MTISKIISSPAFKGSISLRAYEIKNGKMDLKSGGRKTISADDITSIQEEDYYHRECIINTDKKSYVYTYDYPDYGSEICKDGKGRLTDLNTVLNAYMAAKMSDDNFVVKL